MALVPAMVAKNNEIKEKMPAMKTRTLSYSCVFLFAEQRLRRILYTDANTPPYSLSVTRELNRPHKPNDRQPCTWGIWRCGGRETTRSSLTRKESKHLLHKRRLSADSSIRRDIRHFFC